MRRIYRKVHDGATDRQREEWLRDMQPSGFDWQALLVGIGMALAVAGIVYGFLHAL